MLNGRFENCYGIKEFDLTNISFASCNVALIYAPNGVMKSSFAHVFDDISKGNPTKDRIFHSEVSAYSITHYTSQYTYSSTNPNVTPSNRIYVVNSFVEKFEFTKETVGTLLADETTRNSYNVLISRFSDEIRLIEEKLRSLSGITKPQIKNKLLSDLELLDTSDWTDIIEKIHDLLLEDQRYTFWEDCKYSELFSDKAIEIYNKREFKTHISEYIDELNLLLSDNPILSEKFTDQRAEKLGKELGGSNLFAAQHTIHLRDGQTVIHSLEEWNSILKVQLDTIYSNQALSTVFSKLKTLLSKNAEVVRVREILAEHREIIPFLDDITALKKQFWIYCFKNLDRPFEEYYENISRYSTQMKNLYEQAAAQSQRWTSVVEEFNRRFKVPFKVKIQNKANFLLKDETPNLIFDYSRGTGTARQNANLQKDDLMISLSMGEKRALYLLYILFDLERIRQQASAGGGQFLIVADDIADSFDYKNKYAIIEYLNDLAKTPGIDSLILTHNFDFYRTVKLRLGVSRPNCYIAQRNENGIVTMTQFKYQKDFFKQVIIENIKNGNIDDDNKKKLLISSIPFYRNLSEYSGREIDYKKLTCFLHIKTQPLDTLNLTLSDIWQIVSQYLDNVSWGGTDENFYSAIQRIASGCVTNTTNEVLLDNKLVISIAIRLKAEDFLRQKLQSNGRQCSDSSSNQTREWYNQALDLLTQEQKEVIDEVNLITPENIHLNAFMFEPLIDISDWTLKDLYNKVCNL